MGETSVIELPNGVKFYLDGYLRSNLDLFIKKLKMDYDFVIIVSGSGTVRIGKSVLAQQIGAYVAKRVSERFKQPFIWNLEDNFAFTGKELIDKAKKLSKKLDFGGVLIYDEAGGELQTMKRWTPEAKALIDFFRECGQLNLFLILVLPDFFDLPKGIAIARSMALINTRFDDHLNRGRFSAFNFRQKKFLYLQGKKMCDYTKAKPNFHGRFTNAYTIPELNYRKMKREALETNIKAFK